MQHPLTWFLTAHLRLYTNAVLAATHEGTLGPENRAPLLIGGSGGCEPFVGLVDEVSLSSRALSAAEVLAIYQASSAGKCLTAVSASIRVSQVEICWDSLPTANYQVQYRSELTGPRLATVRFSVT